MRHKICIGCNGRDIDSCLSLQAQLIQTMFRVEELGALFMGKLAGGELGTWEVIWRAFCLLVSICSFMPAKNTFTNATSAVYSQAVT